MDGPALCHASAPRRFQTDAVPVSLESFTPVDIGATTKEDLSAEGGTCAARHTPSPPPLSCMRERGDRSPHRRPSAEVGVRGNGRPARLEEPPGIPLSER